jgi:hypothetical protein
MAALAAGAIGPLLRDRETRAAALDALDSLRYLCYDPRPPDFELAQNGLEAR